MKPVNCSKRVAEWGRGTMRAMSARWVRDEVGGGGRWESRGDWVGLRCHLVIHRRITMPGGGST